VSTDKIPIQNIYFLLCYAWNHLQEKDYAEIRSQGCDRLWDLLARVLIRSSQQLVKRGLHRNYVLHSEHRVRPKGKVLFADGIRRPAFGRLGMMCEYDELSADVLPNQIIHATLRRLQRHAGLSADNQRELRETTAYWHSFAQPILTAQTFRRVQIHRNMRHYRFALNVCELIHSQSLPTEDAGSYRFRDFLRDEAIMGTLFEQFVRTFLAKEQSIFHVSKPHVAWNIDSECSTERGLRLLPSMKTDIVLESPTDRLIIDCKFYRDAFQRNFDTQKFISNHLYQMFAYLKNQCVAPGWERVRGMLLYPSVDAPFDEHVSIYGHEIRVVSLNLGQDWDLVSRDLLSLLERTGHPDGVMS
jgi:5-methylcytosine-specific restriction enzyme subunit McrC